MTETAVENNLCADCGVDIRAEALFCYNCGSAVDAETSADQADEGISDAWFREDIAKDEDSDPGSNSDSDSDPEPDPDDIDDKEIVKPDDNDGLAIEKSPEMVVSPKVKPKTKVRRKPKMKSAATLRKNSPKSLPLKKVEVVWEEKENSPNLWFILASVVIVGIVGVLFYLARVLQ